MDTNMILHGSGHFSLGFFAGFLAFWVISRRWRDEVVVQIYVPFLPFVLGIIAGLPYVFEVAGFFVGTDAPGWTNLFLFYGLLHHNEFLARFLNILNLTAPLCGGLYILLVIHYWRLIKRLRRVGRIQSP